MGKRLAYVGECQICERTQKLRGKLLVLHGYRRPGWGWIEGECPGVGHLPYELSCDQCVVYRSRAVEHVKSLTRRLTEIERGEATIKAYKQNTRYAQWSVDYPAFGRKPIEEHDFQPGEEHYEKFRAAAEHRTRQSLKMVLDDIDRLTKRIDNWVLRPIRTVEEEEQSHRAKRTVEALSPKQTKIMRSASKGIKATFSLDDLDVVLTKLGWKTKPEWQPQRITDSGAAKKISASLGLPEDIFWASGWIGKPTAFAAEAKGHGEAGAWELYRQIEALDGFVTSPKAPKTIGEAQTIIYARKPDHHSHDWDRWGVPLTMWHAVPGRRVTAPDGESSNFPVRMDWRGNLDTREVKSDRFWKFAYAHGIQKQAAEWLEEHA
jgi:hypothetical protein